MHGPEGEHDTRLKLERQTRVARLFPCSFPAPDILQIQLEAINVVFSYIVTHSGVLPVLESGVVKGKVQRNNPKSGVVV